MSFEEAIAAQPAWVGYWLNWLLFGAFILPLALMVWRASRVAGIVTLVASAAAAFGVAWMYEQMGYVKLLGLPHIVIWTPLAIYLVTQMKRVDMLKAPRLIMAVVLGTIAISLAFDYVDALRYLLGERTPTAMPATG